MPRGGARPGAGRKRGGKNLKSREVADRLVAQDVTPLEVMLETMRAFWRRAARKKRFDERMLNLAKDAAKDAAPYCHPRLAQIEGNPDKPLIVEHRVDPIVAARTIAFALLRGGMLIEESERPAIEAKRTRVPA